MSGSFAQHPVGIHAVEDVLGESTQGRHSTLPRFVGDTFQKPVHLQHIVAPPADRVADVVGVVVRLRRQPEQTRSYGVPVIIVLNQAALAGFDE